MGMASRPAGLRANEKQAVDAVAIQSMIYLT